MSYSALSKPLLYESQLKYRLGLAKKRLEYYPLDSMNFIMMDLERPQLRTRHAHWCTYDLTGRMLFFYALAEGVDGEHIERLKELFERIMQNRRKSGVFGNKYYFKEETPEDAKQIGSHFISGLVNYYSLTGDIRALNAAQECADYLFSLGDEFYNSFANKEGSNNLGCMVVEGFAELYRETKNIMYIDAIRRITFECVGNLKGAHSHGYMATLRGILRAAIYANDNQLADFVRECRQEIIDSGCIMANGDVSEAFPRSERNEGCSISDWIMLNLLYAYHFGDGEAYAIAEHSLWNALYFNQFVTGGFGHRFFSDNGYRTYIEEAWWCCTPNAGMCLTEVARHTVTIKDGKLKLNFFIPGCYTLPSEHGDITVTITTKYPTKAETIVKVSGTKEAIDIRVPDYIKGYACRRVETSFGYELYLDGKMGHYTERKADGTILKYGPLVLAPMIYKWGMNESVEMESTVPEGYTHENFSGNEYALKLDTPDSDGFLNFAHDPLPEWSIFEEGEMAGVSGGEVTSAHVKVTFSNGEIKDLYFQPLCSATSNLTLMDIPVVFDVVNDTIDAG